MYVCVHVVTYSEIHCGGKTPLAQIGWGWKEITQNNDKEFGVR